MRSKTDFYRLFFEQLARRGFDVKRSQSSDYIADIYFKNQLVAYFSKADTVIQPLCHSQGQTHSPYQRYGPGHSEQSGYLPRLSLY